MSREGWIVGGVTCALVGGFVVWLVRQERKAREPFLADEYIAETVTRAHQAAPDAAVRSVKATFVDPDGRVHTEHDGRLTVTLTAPSRRGAEEPVMLGAPHQGGGAGCLEMDEDVDLVIDEGASLSHDFHTTDATRPCEPSVPGPLHCSIVELWQRAIASGAPHPALADITLAIAGDPEQPKTLARAWTFEIVDRRTDGPNVTVFSKTFADACR